MAPKKHKDHPTYRMWLVGSEDMAVMVKVPERIYYAAHGTLNPRRSTPTLNAQRKVIEAFVAGFSKKHDVQIGDVVTWNALKIEKVQLTTTPRR